mgnify:CR=1 FL=1
MATEKLPLVTFFGVKTRLRPMSEVPTDGTPVLVLLEKESLGRRWHSAQFRSNISIIGHLFAFDLSKPLGWIELPTLVQENPDEVGDGKAEGD